MAFLKTQFNRVRANAYWLGLVLLPIVIAACNNGGSSGGNGY